MKENSIGTSAPVVVDASTFGFMFIVQSSVMAAVPRARLSAMDGKLSLFQSS